MVVFLNQVKKPTWTFADTDDERPDIFRQTIVEGKRERKAKVRDEVDYTVFMKLTES